MSRRTAYEITEPVRGEYRRRRGELITIDLEPGRHVPADAREAELFKHLVTIGAAELAAPAARPQKRKGD